jgi:O-antigen ligase
MLVVIGFLRADRRILASTLKQPIVLTVMCLVFWIIVGVLVGLDNRAGSLRVLREAATLATWLLVPVVFANLRKERECTGFLNFLLFTAVLIGVGHLVEFLTRNQFQLVSSVQGSMEGQLLRNVPDGYLLEVVGLFVALWILLSRERTRSTGKISLAIVVTVTSLSLILTQSRGVIAALVLGFTILLVLLVLTGRISWSRSIAMLLLAFLIVLGATGAGYMALDQTGYTAAINRLFSLPQKGFFFDKRRTLEAVETFRIMQEHPFLGAGFGTEYYDAADFGGGTGALAHNGYLGYLLKLGPAGLFLLTAIVFQIGLMVLKESRSPRTDRAKDKMISIGIALLTIAAIAIIGNVFASIRGLPFFAVSLGLALSFQSLHYGRLRGLYQARKS